MELFESKEEEIERLIAEKKMPELKAYLSEMNEVDVAEILEDMETSRSLILLRLLPKELAISVFSYIGIEKQKEIAGLLNDSELEHILNEMFFDDLIDLLEEMPAEFVSEILKYAPAHERKLINDFLGYPEESAGSIMTIEYMSFKANMTVGEALEQIRREGMSKETVYTCYVVNEHQKLVGIVSLRRLVISQKQVKIKDIMETDLVSVNIYDDQEEVAKKIQKYDFLALPVVDNAFRMTGIVTVDDIIEIIEDETTEDFERMAAMSPSDEEYLDTPIFSLVKNRVTWLLLLMISATLTGAIIRKYETVLASMTVLSIFLPMLMDTSGNAGSQSSTIIVRSLATGDLTVKDWFLIIRKEAMIALTCGIVLALVNFLRMILIERIDISVALVVSGTLVCTVLMAKVLGGLLPVLAKKVNIDPAIMAGPLITTICDAGSLLIYFKFATSILHL